MSLQVCPPPTQDVESQSDTPRACEAITLTKQNLSDLFKVASKSTKPSEKAALYWSLPKVPEVQEIATWAADSVGTDRANLIYLASTMSALDVLGDEIKDVADKMPRFRKLCESEFNVHVGEHAALIEVAGKFIGIIMAPTYFKAREGTPEGHFPIDTKLFSSIDEQYNRNFNFETTEIGFFLSIKEKPPVASRSELIAELSKIMLGINK